MPGVDDVVDEGEQVVADQVVPGQRAVVVEVAQGLAGGVVAGDVLARQAGDDAAEDG
ncbi:hypothetical protein LO772_00085 [Yinghuangia sp. ASG 101]|uniref:hypothetical protein n=1 Tax=Yinghuangia sp. ASG 101 TaxID=2896848 RepID=UPI001E59D669|nr:hypothetical protein [Yinghuangia sp. ASG 101]UGQ12053.1 hypothetical protein LO772_00085 [Yinghuangia sp. ASG 101]